MNFKAKLLKKSLIVLVLILVAGTSFAASGETIIIGGAVPLILDLTVTTTADADNLDLSGADAADHAVVIANIDIATNNSAGWELYAISENDAVMTNADGDDIGYTLSYAGTGGVLLAVPNSTTGILIGEEGGLVGDAGAALTITYDQDTTYPAGYYSDQVALVLRAK